MDVSHVVSLAARGGDVALAHASISLLQLNAPSPNLNRTPDVILYDDGRVSHVTYHKATH